MHRIARVSPRGIPHFQTQLRCRCGPQQPDHAAVFTSRMHHNACTCAGRPTTVEREGSNTSASSQVRRTAARSAPYAPRPDGKARVFRKHNALPYCITLTKHILDVFQINRMQFCAVACSNIRRTGGGRAMLKTLHQSADVCAESLKWESISGANFSITKPLNPNFFLTHR